MEDDLVAVLDRYEAGMQGDGSGDENESFLDLDAVQRKRREDAERRRGANAQQQQTDSKSADTTAASNEEERKETAAAAPTIAALQSTEVAYREAATLLRKLAAGWAAVRSYSHGYQMADRSVRPTTASAGGGTTDGDGDSSAEEGGANSVGYDRIRNSFRPGERPRSPPERAEDILSRLEDLRKGREEAVGAALERYEREQAEQRANGQSARAGTFFGSIGRMFGFGFEDPEDSDPGTPFDVGPNGASIESVTAHKSPEYSAERHLYRHLMKSTIHWQRVASNVEEHALAEDDEENGDGAVGSSGSSAIGRRVAQLELGNHLRGLIREMSRRSNGGNPYVQPNAELYLIAMKIYSHAGLLNAASTAHRMLVEMEHLDQKESDSHDRGGEVNRKPPKLHAYHLVFEAYRNVMTSRKKKDVRQAANKAEKLLDQMIKAGVEPNVITFNLLLDTLARGGHGVIPNLCNRADAVVERMVGKNNFLRLVGDNPLKQHYNEEVGSFRVEPDLYTKHLLLRVYAEEGGSKRYLMRARRLLLSMEQSRSEMESSGRSSINNKRRGTGGREWSEEDFKSLPNRDSYNAVLRSMVYSGGEPNVQDSILSSRGSQEAHESARYGTRLLGDMARHESSQPSKFSFNYVLRLWAKSGAEEAGDRAEELLSKMEVRAVVSTTSKKADSVGLSPAELPRPDALSYQNAIACWGVSAANSYPGAASRAMRLLDAMEAQVNPGFESFGANDSRNYLLDHIYNEAVRPNRYVFTMLIMTCACTQLEEDKSDALRIAFDAYNRMIDAGLTPSSDTYAYLLKCCENLLPHEAQRDQRNELSRTVFDAARDNGAVNSRLLLCLRKCNPVLYESYQS